MEFEGGHWVKGASHEHCVYDSAQPTVRGLAQFAEECLSKIGRKSCKNLAPHHARLPTVREHSQMNRTEECDGYYVGNNFGDFAAARS